jgi:hypothetical protein
LYHGFKVDYEGEIGYDDDDDDEVEKGNKGTW